MIGSTGVLTGSEFMVKYGDQQIVLDDVKLLIWLIIKNEMLLN